jgi:hypothetical protein
MNMNQTFRVNKNWHIDIIEPIDIRRPFLRVIGEFAHRPNVVDYPIHYNDNREKPIAYDYPERIPQFVKNKVAALYEKFPILKCENKSS